jgi:hypothetical protein
MTHKDEIDLSKHPDFENYTIDEDKPPNEYNADERRKDLYDAVMRRGVPKVNQSKVARNRYECDQSRISRDMDVVRAYIAENVDAGFESFAKTLYNAGIRDLVDAGEYGEARKLLKDWREFLFESGRREREPDRHAFEDGGLDVNIVTDEDPYPDPGDGEE